MSKYGWQRKRSLYGNLNGAEEGEDQDDLHGNNLQGSEEDQGNDDAAEESSEIKKRLLNMLINSVLSTGTAIGGAKIAKWIGSTPAFAAGAIATLAGHYTDLKPISGLGLGLIAGGLEKQPEQAVSGLGNTPATTSTSTVTLPPLEKYFNLPVKDKPLDMSAIDKIQEQLAASAIAFKQQQATNQPEQGFKGFGNTKQVEETDLSDKLI